MQKTNVLIDSGNKHHFAYQNIEFNEWKELRNYYFQIKDELTIPGYVYRGHSDADWKVEPSLERLKPVNVDLFFKAWYNNAEKGFIEKYKRAIHLFDDTNYSRLNCKNSIDWLSLMQHHGAATRLLDVTTSPFIASFFALSNVFTKSKNACIWLFPLDIFDKKNAELLGINSDDKYRDVYDIYSTLELGNIDGKQIIGYSFLEKPSRRPFMQKGGFIYSMTNDKNLEELLTIYSNNNDITIKRLVLNLESRNDICHALQELANMNISYSTLFPGLDGYTKDMLIDEYISNT